MKSVSSSWLKLIRFLESYEHVGFVLDVDGTLSWSMKMRLRLDHQKLLQPEVAEVVRRIATWFLVLWLTGQVPEMLLPEILPSPSQEFRFGYGAWRPGDTPVRNQLGERVFAIWAYGKRRLSGNIPPLRMLGVGFAMLPQGATLFTDLLSPELAQAAHAQALRAVQYLARGGGVSYRDLGKAIEIFTGTPPSKAPAALEWSDGHGLEAVVVAGDTPGDYAVAQALSAAGKIALFVGVGPNVADVADVWVKDEEEMAELLKFVAHHFGL